MLALISLALAVVSAVVLAAPFVRRRGRGRLQPLSDTLEEPRRRREAVYQEILTLRVDYEAGTLPEHEYRARLNGYRVRAAAALRDEKLLEERLAALERELEAEIRQARQRLGTAPGPGVVCLHCGATLPAGSGRCPRCGRELPVAPVGSSAVDGT